jgi:hypothetical protein
MKKITAITFLVLCLLQINFAQEVRLNPPKKQTPKPAAATKSTKTASPTPTKTKAVEPKDVKATATTAEKIFYRVSVGNFTDAKLADFQSFIKKAFIYAMPLNGGLMQVFVGNTDNKAIADAWEKQIATKGYADANVVKEKWSNELFTYIQLTTQSVGQPINWNVFKDAGQIYVIPSEKEVRIVSGGFENDSIAKLALTQLKKTYKNAFLQTIAANRVHKIGTFETASDELSLNEALKIEEEKVVIVPSPRPTSEVTIDDYAGRFSNTQLKATLAAMNLYKGKIDNTNDSRLENIFTKAKSSERLLAKYVLLAQAEKQKAENYSELQKAINTVLSNPKSAEAVLKKSSLPIAKAYRAYLLFTSENGDSKEVNKLMNQAIEEAFKGVKENPFQFDPTATYAYQGLGQLILHLRYIQGVAKDEPLAPTWLFTEHPKEATAAFAQGRGYKMVASDDFYYTIEELKMAWLMAQDLNPTWQEDPKLLAENVQLRTQLYYLPSKEEVKKKDELHQWNKMLWEGLDTWSKKDEANIPQYNAFKATYYTAMQRIEKFYANKKMNQDEATIYALAVLKSTVAAPLKKFLTQK